MEFVTVTPATREEALQNGQVDCLIGLGVYLTLLQDHLSLQQQRRDTDQKIGQIRELVQSTGEATQRLKETVDGIYQSKAVSLAYMVREKVDPELSDSVLESYRELLGVNNVFVLDADGEILFDPVRQGGLHPGPL